MPSVTFPAAVEIYLAGYSSAATVAAYRCGLALWQHYCNHHDLDSLGDVIRALTGRGQDATLQLHIPLVRG